ncbi:Bifunctional NAD(P)H-hydrate repair enzyme Nnr [Nitrospira sp. KM1]|uniref:NAD(P)H-hydrate dehydratase n=1 Tax=Nitrospira sp. KM1 TaxID=1936990 RepID=UPI0013A7A3EE|nr:NAD(P)H-hydrate dehydratase [Nitrospira sp. KM1]BCA54997.1 Bifunctional NAD(P)H-hydrate repair enzyme Nnr [Nitrospira sp. KM1]
MKLVSAEQMRELDHRTISEAGIPGTVLMERAGERVVEILLLRYGPLKGKVVTIFCGKGNNGGDGLVVARLLRRHHAQSKVLLVGIASDLSKDAGAMYRRLIRSAGKSAVVQFRDNSRARELLSSSDLVIDALLGTGLSTEVVSDFRAAIELMNSSRRPIIAVDIPSGIHADTGAVLGTAVRASLTITFGLPKRGLYIGSGIDHTGSVLVADIGIPTPFVDSVATQEFLITQDAASQGVPFRSLSSHKGTFGHAGIIAGSVGKTGAAALTAQAALRMGTGLVTVATPSSINDVLEAKLLEVMTVPLPETSARTLARSAFKRLESFIKARDAIAIGPGLSTHEETRGLIQELVPKLDRPSVLDADALNAVAGRSTLLKQCKVPPVLTPHPGEMARLSGSTVQSVNADRIGTARRFAAEFGCIMVLKGARTVLSRHDGTIAICPTGNPGMATAGTGDVLTGMIAGLLAQGIEPWQGACSAVYFHGLAGDLASAKLGQAGMLAGDLLDRIPDALLSAHA